jgi:hypothetical protein
MASEAPLVFISHSNRDAAMTRWLATGLRDAGLRVWVDYQDIGDGENWPVAIQTAIETCAAMVVVMSRHARASDWVLRETLVAQARGIPIFIAMVEPVPLPLHLYELQYTDCTAEADADAALARLAARVRSTVDAVSIPAPADDATAALPSAIREAAEPSEDNFFGYLEQMPGGDTMALIARELYSWAQRNADGVTFSGRYHPGMHVQVALDGQVVTLYSVWAFLRNPKIQVPFARLAAWAPYDQAGVRRSTLRTLNRLLPPEANLHDEQTERLPTFPLAALDRAEALEAFHLLAQEMVDNLRSAP